MKSKKTILFCAAFTMLASLFVTACSEPSSPSYVTKTITFYKNDGSTDSYTQTFTFIDDISKSYTDSVSVKLKKNTFTREGYAFLGWGSYSTATEATYDDEETIHWRADLNLYAVWEKQLTLTLKDSASSKEKTYTLKENQSVDLSSYTSDFSNTNATLIGWSTSEDADTIDYSLTDTSDTLYLKVTEDTTLYSVWKYNPKVIFDGNGGITYGEESEYYQYLSGSYTSLDGKWYFESDSDEITLAENDFHWPDWSKKFYGWGTSADDTVVKYEDKSTCKFTSILGLYADKKLYAIWGAW